MITAKQSKTPTGQIRKGFLYVLKHTLNPLTRRLAGTPYGPFVIIKHVGRRSGKVFETPIIARRAADGFVIELTYGPNVDWYKNVQTAGGCTVVWHGQEFVINHLEPMDAESGRTAFSGAQQQILKLLGRTHFVKLKNDTEFDLRRGH